MYDFLKMSTPLYSFIVTDILRLVYEFSKTLVVDLKIIFLLGDYLHQDRPIQFKYPYPH